MFRDIEMDDFATIVFDDEEAIQDSKGESRHGEEVHGRNGFSVVAQEGWPELAGVVARGQAPEIAGDSAFGYFQAEFQKLTVNSRSAPRRILLYHPQDKSSNLGIDSWPADLFGTRSQAPEQSVEFSINSPATAVASLP
jgi:hypothetical protein